MALGGLRGKRGHANAMQTHDYLTDKITVCGRNHVLNCQTVSYILSIKFCCWLLFLIADTCNTWFRFSGFHQRTWIGLFGSIKNCKFTGFGSIKNVQKCVRFYKSKFAILRWVRERKVGVQEHPDDKKISATARSNLSPMRWSSLFVSYKSKKWSFLWWRRAKMKTNQLTVGESRSCKAHCVLKNTRRSER